MVLLLTSLLLLLLIIHRHLVDDCDDSLGVLHAVPDICCPGGGGWGRGTVWKSEGGGGGDEGRGEGGVGWLGGWERGNMPWPLVPWTSLSIYIGGPWLGISGGFPSHTPFSRTP